MKRVTGLFAFFVLFASHAAMADPHYTPTQNATLSELQYKALYCGYFVLSMNATETSAPGQCPLQDKVHAYLNSHFDHPTYGGDDINPIHDSSFLMDQYGKDFVPYITQELCEHSAQGSKTATADKPAEINSLFSEACHAGCPKQVSRRPEECSAECDALNTSPRLKRAREIMERVYDCLGLQSELP